MQKEWFTDWFNSPYYHKLYNHRNRFEAASFIQSICTYLNLPQGAALVDLACGQGRHSRTLNELGYSVLGLDLSPKNIHTANQYANAQLRFQEHDMRVPFGDSEFDAVLNLFTSFGYFPDINESKQVLQNVKQALKPNSVFIQDYLNTEYVVHNLQASEVIFRAGIEFHIQKSIQNGYIVKDIQFEDNAQEYHFQERVQLLTYSDFKTLYAEVGLNIEFTFGNYALEPFDIQTSERLILVSKPQI